MDPENHETTPHKTPENDPGSAAIIPEDRYGQTLMPGLAPIRPNRLVDGEVTKGVREQVAALRVDFGGATIAVTVSIGLTRHRPGDTLEQTLERADALLYQAKSGGRNRTCAD